MKRLEGGYLGTKPIWSYTNQSGVWSTEQVFSRIQQTFWSGINPIPALAPVFWYDFADPSVVTVSGPGSQISQIKDKGSRGWDLTKSSTGPTLNTWSNGLRCCDWGSAGHGNYLRNSTSVTTNIAEAYVVLQANFGSTFADWYGLMTSISGSPDYNLRVIGRGGTSGFYTVFGRGDFTSCFINNGSAIGYSSGILPGINSPCILRLARLDINAAAGGTATASTSNGLQLGQDLNSTNKGWGGLMGEVLIFSSILNSTDRTNLQTFLARKWGLTLS